MQIFVILSRELETFIPSLKKQITEHVNNHLYPQYSSIFDNKVPKILFQLGADYESIPNYDFKYGDFWLNFYPFIINGIFYLEVNYHFIEDTGQYSTRENPNLYTFEKEFKDGVSRLDFEMKKLKVKKIFQKQ